MCISKEKAMQNLIKKLSQEIVGVRKTELQAIQRRHFKKSKEEEEVITNYCNVFRRPSAVRIQIHGFDF
jgi:glutamyl-tRNA reductase